MGTFRIPIHLIFVGGLLMAVGCQTLRPDPIPMGGYQVHPDLVSLDDQPIEQGKPNRVVDSVGWVVGIPGKLLLWDRRVDNHRLSGETIEAAAEYMDAAELGHVKVRANQYAPHLDWKRLRANRSMHWLPRYALGTLSLGYEAIVPGRIFGGDHYNPYTQTVHLYSDIPAIAWHELAHAKDFSRRKGQGTYALAYSAVPLWHETIASQDVMSYVADRGDREEIAEAVEILYPAYGTYIGGAGSSWVSSDVGLPLYYASVLGSHVNARLLARKIRRGDDLGPLTLVAMSNPPADVTTEPLPTDHLPSEPASVALAFGGSSDSSEEPSIGSDLASEVDSGMIDQQLAASSSPNPAVDRPELESVIQTVGFQQNIESPEWDAYEIEPTGMLRRTTFRGETPVTGLGAHVAFGTRSTNNHLDVHFSPSSTVRLGDSLGVGLDAQIPLTSLGMPKTLLTFQGYRSEDSATDPLLVADSRFEYIYDTNQFDVRVGSVWDANVDRDELRSTSDRIYAGLGYRMFQDRFGIPVSFFGTNLDDRFGPSIFGTLTQTDTNHLLNLFFDYERHVDWGRWRWTASVGAFGGANAIAREETRRLYSESQLRGSDDELGPVAVEWSAGQSARLQGQFEVRDSVELTAGVRFYRTSNLSSAIDSLISDHESLITVRTTDAFAGASINY